MKKTQKPIVEYIMSSIIVLAVSLMFSILSIVFLVDTIPWGVQFAVSFIFIAPIWFLTFTQGKSAGGKLYKKCSETSLNNIHNNKGIIIPYYKCIYHMLVYAVPLIILVFLSVVLDDAVLHFIASLFLMPVMLMFSSIKLIVVSNLNYLVFIIYFVYILIIFGAFVLGYFLKINALKRQQRDIENELRQFNN